jgi:transmembrane sensor
MENKIIVTDELIAKYLTGNASPEEAMMLHEWQEGNGNKDYFDQFQSAWLSARPDKGDRVIDQANAWKKVSQRLVPASQKSYFLSRATLLKIAASVTIALIAGAILLLSISKEESIIQQMTQNTVENITLPDQSDVTLSRNARIEYQKEFKGSARELTLQGEAFFKVTPNKEKPFIIHTENADIKVIGTSFNVNSNNGDLEVSVVEGKVLVIADEGEQYIAAGNTAHIRASSPEIEVQHSVDLNTLGYATHRFFFKNTPLVEVFRDIEKSYPFSINVSDKAIENCKLTATFENASVENILSLVAETLDLVVTKNGQTFVLQGTGCP